MVVVLVVMVRLRVPVVLWWQRRLVLVVVAMATVPVVLCACTLGMYACLHACNAVPKRVTTKGTITSRVTANSTYHGPMGHRRAIMACMLKSVSRSQTAKISFFPFLFSISGYSDKGQGKCLTLDNKEPAFEYFGNTDCAKKCSEDASCGGYSQSSHGNCLLWKGKLGQLKGGGDPDWGEAHCMTKTGPYLLKTGTCPAGFQATSKQCEEEANKLNLTFGKTIRSSKRPHGCYAKESSKTPGKWYAYYNSSGLTKATASSDVPCVCYSN